MIFTDLELQDIKRCMDLFLSKRRPAENLRHENDLSYRITGHDIDIFELHASDESKKPKMVEQPSIKVTYVEDSKQWTLYWMRPNAEWHLYQDDAVPSFSIAMRIVDRDEFGCFFG